ncbi:glycosyltransferase family 9 protein [Peredibacter starrii]|uniref:Glycosyltransferase family 9 protein n=1 Tax=Peredibacter starrii TaxID=28202 RepID=A0AAX4HR74_9BACT|nr:glycosyltransferase family 9 protein [Peredibacter starrii]WPU65845.1 glycosyltransferase family 9 protein [Peredibacter starrii]
MEKLTLIFLQGLGNSILNFPIYYSLIQKYDVEILTYKNGSSDFYRELGAKVTEVASLKDLLVKSYRNKSDIVITLYPNWRRELVAINLADGLRKYHFKIPKLSQYFIGRCLEVDHEIHDVENNLRILRVLGLKASPYRDYLVSKTKSSFTGKYIVLHPTASTMNKYYPLDFWQELVDRLSLKFDRIFILCGHKEEEKNFCGQIVGEKVELKIGLKFNELFSLINGTEFFIGLDSSMMHLAALFDKKIYALWSFADMRRIYPYSSDVSIIAPVEVLETNDFKYPKSELPWLKRMSGGEMLKIIEGKSQPNKRKTDLNNNDVKIYVY